MQKAKSILVKVLTLICILCTSLTLAFGLTGCKDGVDGKDGKDGVGVQKVEINESTGKLEVTLTDGNKIVVEDQLINTCKHTTVKEYQVSYGTCVAPAEYLTVCDVNGGCGFAKITRKAVADEHVIDADDYNQYLGSYYGTDEHISLNGANPCAEGSVFSLVCDCGKVLKSEPSNAQHVFCEKNAECGHKTCETSVCHACGEAEEGYVPAHGTYTWITVVDNNANICEDGAHEIYVCEDCLTGCTDCEDAIIDTKEIAAEGHAIDVDTWYVDVEPTLENAGAYVGYCTVCGTNATIELPKLDKNNEAYNYEETLPPQCNADGYDTYKFEYFGEELAECVFTVTTTAAHTDRNGQVIDKDKVYKFAYVQAYGKVEVDSEPTCQETCQGILYCDNCTGFVVVDVIGEHVKGAEIVDRYVPATCVSYGYRYYACERENCQDEDGIVEEQIAKLAHNYTSYIDVANSKVVYTCDCGVEGCECTETYDVAFFETGVETSAATCKTNGYRKPWYIVSEGSEKVYLEEEVIPATGHYYAISADEKHVYKDTAYTYSELVEIFGASNIGSTEGFKVQTEIDSNTNCETSAEAAVHCSECGGLVIVTVYGDDDWTVVDEVSATCYADAYVDYVCAVNPEHTKRVVATGTQREHDLVYSEELSSVADNKIVFVCSYEDCDHKVEITCKEWTEVDTDSTCTTPGTHYIDYTYEDPATGLDVSDRLYLTETKPLSAAHHYGEELLDKNKVYTYSELVAIFGEGNIGSTEGFILQTEVDAAFNCQNVADAVTHCTDCGGLVIINASGDHDWTDWTIVPAKCGKDGYKYRTCKVEGCVDGGKVTTETVVDEGSALSHDYELTFVKPTLTEAGSVTVTCKNGCDLEEVIVLPALNATDYVVDEVVENDCANEGLTKYYIDIEFNGEVIYEDYFVEIVTPIIEHEGAEPPFVKTWEYNNVIYTGYYCSDCEKIIVTNTAPKA